MTAQFKARFDSADSRWPQPVAIWVDMAAGALRSRVLAAVRACPGMALIAAAADAALVIRDTPGNMDLPVVVIGDRATLAAALHEGAAGALLAGFSPRQLQVAVEAALLGLTCTDQSLYRNERAQSSLEPHALADETDDPASPLTAREAEVLAELISGASNKQIARVLGISVHTVKFHVAAIIAKHGASGRTDAVARALRAGQVLV